ncbi:MAG: LysM peptidoglycan-binding domain-containing protein [Clostridia bacterium]|nr:LysM peptidoglycan-binding domain-containing protein [Clostridia bacterium]
MQIHTVQRGDNVYSIARQYNVPASRIITDNMLMNPSQLVVGQDLVILFPLVTHTVRGGDTLSGIAESYGVPLLTLYRNNPQLSGVPGIFPGQVLNIAYPPPPLGPIRTNGYAYTNIDRTVLRRTLPYLTYLSVFNYGITEDGQLLPPAGDEEEIIAICREYRTLPLLVLTSLTEAGTFSSARAELVLNDPDLQAQVIGSVVETVRAKGYGGVDVDFEYIPAGAADAYARFVTLLQDALGEDGVVFVSLSPKYRADQPGLLYEGHDYPALGAAADNVLVMTYEWGYTYGPPRAVSPLPEVRRVLEYAVSEIPPEKIFMGVPNYGYDWPLPYIRGETKARSLGNTAAVEQALQRGAAIEYDETEAAPFYRYFDRPETYSDAVEHEVWFQNARSADAQLRLVREFGLGGMGVWNLMRYFPSLWLVLNSLYSIEKVR